MIAMIKNGEHPASIIYKINQAAYIQETNTNIYSAIIKLAALFSGLLPTAGWKQKWNNPNWIKISDLYVFKKNPGLFRVFMGLFTQQSKGIFLNTFDFHQMLVDSAEAVLRGQYFLYDISSTTVAIDGYIKDINSCKSISCKASAYINISNQIINLADKSLGVLPSKVTGPEREIINKMRSIYIPVVTRVDSLIYNIENKQYSRAIYQADTLLGYLFKGYKTFNTNDDTSLNTAKKIISANDSLDKKSAAFLHYGLFITAIAQSTDASDVKDAINAFALPTGSSRIKKQNDFSWGLNGYVGIYYSLNTQYHNVYIPKTSWGITAPLGLAFNWGHQLGGRGSVTAFVGIIDIGAIFTYKINNDSSVNATIQLGQILFLRWFGAWMADHQEKLQYSIITRGELSMGTHAVQSRTEFHFLTALNGRSGEYISGRRHTYRKLPCIGKLRVPIYLGRLPNSSSSNLIKCHIQKKINYNRK